MEKNNEVHLIRLSMQNKKTLLCIFAHPSDESFFAGGTIALYKKMGWYIHVICATNGKTPDDGTDTEEGLVAMGRKEMESAAQILKIDEITFLDNPDGNLKSLSPGTLEDPFYQKMTALLPDIVLTHDTLGINNDPDNIKVCYATTYAFQKYVSYLSDLKTPKATLRGQGKGIHRDEYLRAFGVIDPESKEPKLYYMCLPTHVVAFMQAAKQLPKEAHELPWKGTPDKAITTVIDIKEEKIIKGQALLCYETRAQDVDQFIDFDKNPSHNQEYFLLRMQGEYEVFMGKNDRVADFL